MYTENAKLNVFCKGTSSGYWAYGNCLPLALGAYQDPVKGTLWSVPGEKFGIHIGIKSMRSEDKTYEPDFSIGFENLILPGLDLIPASILTTNIAYSHPIKNMIAQTIILPTRDKKTRILFILKTDQ